MLDFDKILGMDLLHKCYATIDYRNRAVRFQLLNELKIKWEGRALSTTTQIVQILSKQYVI